MRNDLFYHFKEENNNSEARAIEPSTPKHEQETIDLL